MAVTTPPLPQGPYASVGQRARRVDAHERVTGRAVYPADFNLPRQLIGQIKRSPHAHARIRRIDTSRAEALPGVKAIVTAADFVALPVGASIPFGETGQDIWSISLVNMARDKAMWIGQPIAAVAATDARSAAAAIEAIEVEYDVLEPVMDIAAAIRPGAPVIHENYITKGIEPTPRQASNVGARTLVSRDDTAAAIASAAATATHHAIIDTAHHGSCRGHRRQANFWRSTGEAGAIGLSRRIFIPAQVEGLRNTWMFKSRIFSRNVLRLRPNNSAARIWLPRVAVSAAVSSGCSTWRKMRRYKPGGGSSRPWLAKCCAR